MASPDTHVDPGPGGAGSYYYHWMRDGALSTHALMTTADSLSDVTTQLDAYVSWVVSTILYSSIKTEVEVLTYQWKY